MSNGALTLIPELARLTEDPSLLGLAFPSEKLATPLSIDDL
jgi:hypothetical protein